MTGFHFNGTAVPVLSESRFPFHWIPGSLGPEYSSSVKRRICAKFDGDPTDDFSDLLLGKTNPRERL